LEKVLQAVKNVVLVHGAWADGSSWSKVIPLLQAKGLHVACAQNPLSSIEDDVASTNRTINAQDGPVLLVGHSYGGAVITVAGDNPKVSGLVYVAAFAPDEGETLGGMAAPFGATPLFSELQPIEDGYLLLTAKGVAEDFAQDLSTDEQSAMVVTQAAIQGAILTTPISKAAWHTKPSWVVISDKDRAISPNQQKSTAKRMKATKTLFLPTSHVAMLAKPKEVADFITQAAESLGSSQMALAS
jgi:pimeloyl-ACP methyl ester carboxylesterase